jgi:glucose/arabinose dehydrogenase
MGSRRLVTLCLPTIKFVKARGWAADGTHADAAGTAVSAYARQLDHPRWLSVLPKGDVLAAETNAPSRPDEGKGRDAVAVGQRGALLVADDVGNTIWRVSRGRS